MYLLHLLLPCVFPGVVRIGDGVLHF